MFQKLDRWSFPISRVGPDLGEWKAYKGSLEVALRIRLRMLRIRQILSILPKTQNFAQFLQLLTFILV